MAGRLATLAAAKNKKHLDGFGPPMDGFDQVPLGDIEAVKKAIGPETAGIMVEPLQGEGGVRTAPPPSSGRCGRSATTKACCLPSTRCRPGIGRLGEMFGYQKLGVTPDVMASRQGPRRGLSDRRRARNRRGRQGHDAGHPWLDLRRQPAGDGGGNAMLDVVTKPGFLDHVRRSRCCSSSGSPRSRTGIRR